MAYVDVQRLSRFGAQAGCEGLEGEEHQRSSRRVTGEYHIAPPTAVNLNTERNDRLPTMATSMANGEHGEYPGRAHSAEGATRSAGGPTGQQAQQ